MSKKTFTATFSTGETVTRKSEHSYVSASALVNRHTGQLKNVSFSAKPGGNPSANWGGMRMSMTCPNWAKAQGQQKWEAKAKANNDELDATWVVEVVNVI